MGKVKTYVLDACAVLALFNDEAGADIVDDLLSNAANSGCVVIMNKYNLLEVYYGYLREDGEAFAEQQLASIAGSCIKIEDVLSDDLLRQAGKLKATYKISLADAMFAAQVTVSGAIAVTADHHELDVFEQRGKIEFLWIR